jgi:hypothetical protein
MTQYRYDRRKFHFAHQEVLRQLLHHQVLQGKINACCQMKLRMDSVRGDHWRRCGLPLVQPRTGGYKG